ncbi:MAG: hypothetical protein V3V95_09020 [Thermodesulfobacteriota bacterium]
MEENTETTNRQEWWKLPFDTMSNFSLLGFFAWGASWVGNRKKMVDMTLDE